MLTPEQEYKPREYSAILGNAGIILCDKEEGAFLVLRNSGDLEKLKELLDKFKVVDGKIQC